MTLTANEKGFSLYSEQGALEINEKDDFTPGDLFITAIGACSGLVFKRLLANRKIVYDDLQIDMETKRAVDEEPRRFVKITVRMRLTGHALPERLIQRLFHQVRRNCTIAQSVKGAIEVEEQLEIVDLPENG